MNKGLEYIGSIEYCAAGTARFGALHRQLEAWEGIQVRRLKGRRNKEEVKRLILTCSGGPFFGLGREETAGKTK